MHKGICEACATQQKTIIIPEVHRFPGYIACDSKAQSEIVVPLFNFSGALLAVLDVDSERLDAFDEVGREYLHE